MHNSLGIFKKEATMILKDRIIVIAIPIILCFTVYGLLDTTSANEMSLSNLNRTSLTIALISTSVSSIVSASLFAIITCFTLSRDIRKKSTPLMDSGRNSTSLFFIRVSALVFYAVFMATLTFAISFIVESLILGIKFNFWVNFFTITFINLASMLFSIFICSGVYLITQSIDIVFLVFASLFFIGMKSENYMINWIGFPYSIYSDFAGIQPIARLIIYSRIFQLPIFLSIFILGILFRRRYEFSAVKSFFINIKSFKVILSLVFIAVLASFIYLREPYIESRNIVYKDMLERVNNKVDNRNISLREVKPYTVIDTKNERIICDVIYKFTKLQNENYIDFKCNTGLKASYIYVNNKAQPGILIDGGDVIRIPLPKEKNIDIRIKYAGKIKNWEPAGFSGYICKDSVYLLENSNWLLSPRTGISNKLKVNGSVKAPSDLEVITVGKINGINYEKGYKIWNYISESSGFDIGIFAGKYKLDRFKVGNIDVEFYYSPKHEDYIKGAKIHNQIEKIIAYYEKNFGEYPFKEVPFKIVETSQYKTGGHSTQNLVTVSEYMMNREKAIYNTSKMQGENQYSYIYYHDISIIAHEISHQWWGGGVDFSGDKSWLGEGIANYSSYMYLKSEFGNQASQMEISSWERDISNANREYLKENNLQDRLSKEVQIKIGLYDTRKNAYSKVPLELIRIEKEGKCNVISKLSNIYRKYKMKSITYSEFLDEMNVKRGEIKID